jgi:hypothetical protein
VVTNSPLENLQGFVVQWARWQKNRAKRGIKFGRFDPPPPGYTATKEELHVGS